MVTLYLTIYEIFQTNIIRCQRTLGMSFAFIKSSGSKR